MRRIPIFLFALVLLSACGANQSIAAKPAIQSVVTAVPPTIAAQEEAILDEPTQAPVPVALDAPTQAPASTATAPTAAPAPTTQPATARSVKRIVIKNIELDETTVSVGLDQNRVPIVPKHEVGWYNLSAAPGQGSNIVLWGHVLRFKATPNIPAPFRRLKELQPGAEIVLYDENNTARTYAVTDQIWVTPDQVQYILPTSAEQVTLVSCIGDKVQTEAGVEMTHRLITIAKPVS